ncbi:MAG: hypothetical protein OSB09_10485, partial [Planctomycetota bacterium]|nr:hypothetical protein [Planctomycetota bacterium]
ISTLVHVIVAFFIAGTLFFQWRAVHPAVAAAADAKQIREAIRGRWAPVMHIGTVLLIGTGIYQLMVLGMPKADLQKSTEAAGLPYHMLFGIKFLLALGILFIGNAMVGKSAALAFIREKAPMWLALACVMVIAVIVISRHLAEMPA